MFDTKIGRKTIGNIINKTNDLPVAYSDQNKIKSGKSSNLDSAMRIWIDLCSQNNIPLTDLIIKAKALKYTESLNVDEIKASRDWLKNLKREIQLHACFGETGDLLDLHQFMS